MIIVFFALFFSVVQVFSVHAVERGIKRKAEMPLDEHAQQNRVEDRKELRQNAALFFRHHYSEMIDWKAINPKTNDVIYPAMVWSCEFSLAQHRHGNISTPDEAKEQLAKKEIARDARNAHARDLGSAAKNRHYELIINRIINHNEPCAIAAEREGNDELALLYWQHIEKSVDMVTQSDSCEKLDIVRASLAARLGYLKQKLGKASQP